MYYHFGQPSADCAGGSYFAMTPDLHMVHTSCIVVRDNHLVIAGDNATVPGGATFPQFPTLLIPLGVATEKRSISCQTDGAGPKSDNCQQKLNTSATSSSHHTTDDDPMITPKRLFERSRSVRESRRKSEKIEALTRSESLRYSSERSTQVVKDINLKTCNAHHNKAKGQCVVDYLLLDLTFSPICGRPVFALT